jgi:hypothetical protein
MRGRKLRIGETSVRLNARNTKTCSEKADNSGTLRVQNLVRIASTIVVFTPHPPKHGLTNAYWERWGRILCQFAQNSLPVDTSMSKSTSIVA